MLKKFAAIALAVTAGASALVLTACAADEKPAASDKAVAHHDHLATKVEWPKPDADGFISLFNGKDLTGWAGQEGFWSVKDGAIVASEKKDASRQTFLVLQGMNVSDFELHYQYKFVTAEGNSGMQFRSKVLDPKVDPYRIAGYQADCDATNGYTGIIYDEAGGAGKRNIMSKRGEKTHWDEKNKAHAEPLPKTDAQLKELIKVGDWNECVVVAKGNHVTYSINGNVTTDLTDDSPKAVKEGLLAIQCHQGFTMEVMFKDIKLKPLTGDAK